MWGFFIYIAFRTKDIRLNILLLLFASTDLIGFYFWDWGEPDVVMIPITIIACILIIKNKYIWLIPVLLSLCMMIHEAYVMMYFSVVIGLLFIRYTSSSGKDKKRYLSCLLTTGLLCSLLFIYFYFFTVYSLKIPKSEFLHIVFTRNPTLQTIEIDFWSEPLKLDG